MKSDIQSIHPLGEGQLTEKGAQSDRIEVDTFDGKLHVEWDPNASVTPIVVLILRHGPT